MRTEKNRGEILMKLAGKIMRLISIRKGKSEKGYDYAFLKLADKETYENLDCSLNSDQIFENFKEHSDYAVEFDIQNGRDGNVRVSATLTPEKSAKAS